MNKPDNYYVLLWLELGTKAVASAKVLNTAGLPDQSLRMLAIGHYCMKRHQKAQIKFISARRERSQQTAGAVIFSIVIIAVIHYIITH